MKRLTVFEPGSIGFEEVTEPPLRPVDVRIRVKYCGICGTDLGIYTGSSGIVREGMVKYPSRIGHEWSGIVEQVGKNVIGIKPGDRVITMNSTVCGECPACLDRRVLDCPRMKAIGTISEAPGAFAETMTLPYQIIYAIPDSLGFDEAALVEPASIAYNGLSHFDFSDNPTLVITGTGAIGLAAVSLAKHMGAGKVILAGRKDMKLDIGLSMGADVAVNTTRESMIQVVLRETGGQGAQIVLEASGCANILLDSVDFVKTNGQITSVSFYEQPLSGLNIDRIVMRGIMLTGIYEHPGVIKELLKLLDEGKLSLLPLISHVYPFDQAPEAFMTANDKGDTKIKMLIKID